MVPFQCFCRPPLASGAPSASPSPRGLRQWPGSAGRPFRGQPGAGIPAQSARAFVMVPEPPPPPQASVSRSLNLAAGMRRNPERAGRPAPDPWRGAGSGAPGGRAHVGLLWVRRLAEPRGKAKAVPGAGESQRHPGPTVASRPARLPRRRWAPAPRAPPPRSPPVPLRTRLRPGPGPRRRPAHPYSHAARSAAGAAAPPPSPRPRRPAAAPFVSARQCPRCLPRPGPAPHSPPPGAARLRAPRPQGSPAAGSPAPGPGRRVCWGGAGDWG